MGRLIPAGTGNTRYENVGIQIDAPADLLEGPTEQVAREHPPLTSPEDAEGIRPIPGEQASPGDVGG